MSAGFLRLRSASGVRSGSLRRCALIFALLLAQGGALDFVHAGHDAPGGAAACELPGDSPERHDEHTCPECLAVWQFASASLASPASLSQPCVCGACAAADAQAIPEAAPDSIQRPRAPPATRLA